MSLFESDIVTENLELATAVERLRHWRAAYYNGTPEVSDAEYDIEEDRVVSILKVEDPHHAFLREIGAPVSDDGVWPKFKHPRPMGSLGKARAESVADDFSAWRNRDGGKGTTFHLTEKIDGCTVVAVYQQNKLKVLATRGDGVIGDDITPNAKFFKNIPLDLGLPEPIDVTLRGEAYITLSDFAIHGTGFANPRNATSGKLRDTGTDDLKSHVRMMWFEVVEISGVGPETHEKLATFSGQLAWLREQLHLVTPPEQTVNIDQIWATYNQYCQAKREALDYWIDGLVIRVPNVKTFEDLGSVGNRPKGAIALKFPATGRLTKILGVEINRGKQGRFTPVALVTPVEIDGTTVSRVTLNNYDWIAGYDLAIGDQVEIIKGGDIIPKIIRKVRAGEARQPITPPTECDACGFKLEKFGAYLECHNEECDGQSYGLMSKWLSVLDIKGVGPSHLRELIADGIDDPHLLYTATEDEIVEALHSEAIGVKVYKAIQKHRQMPLASFLTGLNISSLGNTNGVRLAAHFKDLASVLKATRDEILAIDGIGDTNVAKIREGLKTRADLIKRLSRVVTIETPNTSGILSGKSFCITGSLPSGRTRKQLVELIEKEGGEVRSSVGKGLDYLITDEPDSGSSKNKAADKLGVKKISEEYFDSEILKK